MDAYLRVSGADSIPQGPSGLSYFCFGSPVLGPGDRDRNQLPALGGAQPGVGMVHAASVRLSLPVCAHGASSPGAGELPGCHAEALEPGPKGGLGEQPDPGRSVGLGSGKLLEKVELTKIPRSFSQP